MNYGPENTVPFLDVGATYRELAPAFDAAYHRVMESGWYLLGEELTAFEQAFAAASGAQDAVGVASGLDALVLALRALGIGPGDEVIVPSNTYIATWLAVNATGAKVIPVEPDPQTFLIDAQAAAAAISNRTAALMPVHLYGLPADMPSFIKLADHHQLALVTDAAQAHGSTIEGQPIGGMGHATCWSFYPGKNLGAFADAGAVTINDASTARRLRRLRNYGSEVKYVHEETGVNSRLDELQAAFLAEKLRHLGEWNVRRQRVADEYSARLDASIVTTPSTPEGRTSAWHLYVVLSERRDELQEHLASLGIQTLIHYPIPPHLQDAYADLGLPAGSFPVAERLAETCLSLPIGPHLSADEVERVVDGVNSFRVR